VKFSDLLKTLSLVFCSIVSGAVALPRQADGEEKKNDPVSSGAAAAAATDSLPGGSVGLDTTVVYSARDSVLYHFDRKTMELFGKARVDYRDMTVRGPSIVFDYPSSLVSSRAAPDLPGQAVMRPVFTDRNGSFSAETMTYNMKTREGRTTSAFSKDELGFYTGREATRSATGELTIRDGVFTTCDLDEPHYWFEGGKMSIIPKKRLVSRPFIMYVRPEVFSYRFPALPLIALPYMVFPLNNERSSGFLVPRIGRDSQRGYYLSNLGYFWALSDHLDIRLEGDLALNGSWRAGNRLRYNSNNLFSGAIEGEYERYVVDGGDTSGQSRYNNWFARIVHHQDFDPTAKFDLNLHYQGGERYYDVNSVDPETIVTEQATSYASFSKSYNEGGTVLTASYQRTEDLRNDDRTQTLSASLYQNPVYPFRPWNAAGTGGWRSRFSVTPSASVTGRFSSIGPIETDDYTGNADVLLAYQQDFSSGSRANLSQGVTLQGRYRTVVGEDDRWGTRVQFPLRIQSTLFRHLNINPSLTFTRYEVDRSIRKYYDAGSDQVVTLVDDSPEEFSTYTLSVDAQTRLYGTVHTGFLEDIVGLKALRHTLIPTVTFRYNPDYTGEAYDYYGSYADAGGLDVRYNRFGQSLYETVPSGQRSIGITLQNLFQGRFRNRDVRPEAEGLPGRDEKVVQLLSLTASTSYNFAADSLRLAPLTVTASSNALSPHLLFSAGATYDFYSFDPVTGTRIDKPAMEGRGGLLRFLKGFLNMSVSLDGNLRSRDEHEDEDREGETTVVRRGDAPVEQGIFRERFGKAEPGDFSSSLPWKLRMSLYLNADRSDPLNPETTSLLNASAKVSLSKNWQVGFNTGYDLQANDFIFPAIQLFRDLHCWQFSFQWVPSGEYQSYYAQVALKAPQLDDIKFWTGGSLNR